MADEITTTVFLKVAKNSINLQRQISKLVTMTGNAFNYGVQTIGTTQEAIVLGDVGTAGYCLFRNTDGTNFVEIGREDGGTFRAVVKLLAGECALFRAGGTLMGKADTASCRVECWVVEA
jgi:hypothetical protein